MGMDLHTLKPLIAEMEESNPINGFEGVEKRLEVGFSPLDNAKSDGLRRLSQQQVNDLLKLAECTIVSELHNSLFDSYVLSESSLFIYPYKIIIKTCGRTQLLKCISLLLSYAFNLSLEPCFCKYNHGTFIFPLSQPFPYNSFEEEVKYLNTFFGHMGPQAYTMGNQEHQTWHIYSASTHNYTNVSDEPTYTLEMCMTELDKGFTANFFNESGSKTGKEMTMGSGIAKILPNASICDFAFVPCGYSMNGMDGSALSTIHITPEETHSYASFEAMGYSPQSLNLQALVDCVLSSFKPASLLMSIHVSRPCDGSKLRAGSWGSSVLPFGYDCDFSQREELPGHGVVTFHTFHRSRANKVQDITVIPEPLFPFSITEEEAMKRATSLSDNDSLESFPMDKKKVDRNSEVGLENVNKVKQGKREIKGFSFVVNELLLRPCKYNIEDSDSEAISYAGSSHSSSLTNSVVSSEDEDEHEQGDDAMKKYNYLF